MLSPIGRADRHRPRDGSSAEGALEDRQAGPIPLGFGPALRSPGQIPSGRAALALPQGYFYGLSGPGAESALGISRDRLLGLARSPKRILLVAERSIRRVESGCM